MYDETMTYGKSKVRDYDSDEEAQKLGDLSSLTTHSRGRQLSAGTLDAKILKALKRQEDKRDKRNFRKKEVRCN